MILRKFEEILRRGGQGKARRRRNLEMFLRKFEEILRRGDRGKPPQAKYGGVFEEICGNPETRGQGSDEEIWMILRKFVEILRRGTGF